MDVSAEAKLQKKISVSVKAEPVNEALKRIGTATGAQVSAAANLWDLKVSVFCKDEPAGPIMDRIADVLACEWVKDGEVYRLEMARETQQQRSAYEQAEARFMRQEVEKRLAEYTRLAKTNPNAPKLAPLGTGLASTPPAKPDPITLAFGQMLGAMGSAAWASFWRGDVQTFAPFEMPAPSSGRRGPNDPPERPTINEAKRIVVQFDPSLATLARVPGNDGSLSHATLIRYEQPPAELKDLPFAKAVATWNDRSSIPSDDDRYKAIVQPPFYRENGYFQPKPTMADQIEAFFKSSGIPVVGDEFSVASNGRAGSIDARSWLTSMQGVETKVDKGIVGVRHNAFWRLRQFEVPENVRSSYEQLADLEPLTLENYVSFVARLKPMQLAGLTVDNGTVLGFDTKPLVKMGPALQFYAMLSPEQKRQAHSGLDARTLSDVQKRAFANALMGGVLKGYGQPSYIGRMMTGDFTELGVLVAEEAMEGVKDKRGKAMVGARKFHLYLGRQGESVRFESEVKGKEKKEGQ